MRTRAILAAVVAAATAAGTTASIAAPSAPTVVKTTLHFAVHVGPANDTACDIVGDLYRPSTASRAHPVPAILTTNGFGGSKDDQAPLGQFAPTRGYAVLSYSGLGFGGSGCKIQLDDPDWDGKAASQLISFLGGAPGIAFTDAAHTKPFSAPDYIVHDARAANGQSYRFDPRVGMVGGSYGGQIQFAAAGVDPRLDTIVPIITWNDLAYSLAPNNTDFAYGVTSSTPGVLKVDWPTLFTADGIADGAQGYQADPNRDNGCPNFDNRVCDAYVQGAALGYPTEPTLAMLRHASVESYMSRIRIPTLLMQGENDTLFDLQEAVATYSALRRQGTPVKMVWQSWGHSGGPAPGDFALDSTALSTYEGQRIFAWFDHYLKGANTSTGPNFAYWRSWVKYSGHGPDTAQYGNAGGYPAGSATAYYLSGSNALVPDLTRVQSGTAAYTNAPGTAPTSYSETSDLQASFPDGQPGPVDGAGTYAAYSTGTLSKPLDVAGIPSVVLHLNAPTVAHTQFEGPAGMLEVFAKLYDVAPDGSVTLVNRLVSAVRVGDVTQPVTVQLPGLVHRFDTGHKLQLVLAASDAAFKASATPQPVLVTTSRTAPGTLSLPVVS